MAQSVSHTFSSLPSVIVGDFDPVGMVKRKKALLSIVKYLLWGYNLLMIVVNSVRANRGEKVVYRPAFKFLGK